MNIRRIVNRLKIAILGGNMRKSDPKVFVALVQVDEQDGSYHATSEDIPGLHVCGPSREDVLADIPQCIVKLYKFGYGQDVEVQWADSPASKFHHIPHSDSTERFVMRPAH